MGQPSVKLYHGDCLRHLPGLPTASVDLVLTDPPYPCVKRSYGVWTEAQWFALMRGVVPECMRVLKPSGSAVFILQPNSERVGRMRTWLWEFLAWVGKEYGIVQDAWWWNPATPPTVHVHRTRGGLRPSVKACVWLGNPNGYRAQDAVLWTASDATQAAKRTSRALRYHPSGYHNRVGPACSVSIERGGVTPFNLIPVPNTDSVNSAGAHGHSAGCPRQLCEWWIRYLCPPGGIVLDPFAGVGTVPLAAQALGRNAVGIEQSSDYVAVARRRIRAARREAAAF